MRIKFLSIVFLVMGFQVCLADSSLKFDWGGSKAQVTETIEKNNTSATFKYMIELVNKADGLVVEQNFVELVSMNGEEVSDPRMNRVLGGLAKMPRLLIDSNGNVIDVVNEDDFFKRYGDSFPDPKLKEALENPAYREILLMQFFQKWCYWVCMWNEEGLSENRILESSEDVEFMGSVLPQKTIIKHHGFISGSSKIVKLSLESVTDFDQPQELVDNVTDKLGVEVKLEPDKGLPQSLSKVMTVAAEIEQDTLKPHKVTVETRMSVKSSGTTESKEEKYTFEFQWK